MGLSQFVVLKELPARQRQASRISPDWASGQPPHPGWGLPAPPWVDQWGAQESEARGSHPQPVRARNTREAAVGPSHPSEEMTLEDPFCGEPSFFHRPN